VVEVGGAVLFDGVPNVDWVLAFSFSFSLFSFTVTIAPNAAVRAPNAIIDNPILV
jgi:hypothetical protein